MVILPFESVTTLFYYVLSPFLLSFEIVKFVHIQSLIAPLLFQFLIITELLLNPQSFGFCNLFKSFDVLPYSVMLKHKLTSIS